MPLPKDIIVHNEEEQNQFIKEREAFIWGVIGKNRTGKSTLAQTIARLWKATRPNDNIVAHDPQHRFRDIADVFIETHDEDWAEKLLDLSNALIIIDELRMLHEGDRMSKGMIHLCSKSFEQSIDILYIVHNPAMVLNRLTYFTTKYLIFATEVREGGFKDKIPNHTLCQAAAGVLNKYVAMYGLGKHPLDAEYNGEDFPYIEVDNSKNTMTSNNMPESRIAKSTKL